MLGNTKIKKKMSKLKTISMIIKKKCPQVTEKS